MGTRHLITIVKDGEFKLAQYGQWDGMPAHQGSNILAFLTNGDIEALKRGVDKLFYVSEKELDALHQACGIPKGQDWVNMVQSDKIKETFPTIHRDTGAKIFDLLASGSPGAIHDLKGRTDQIPTSDMLSFAGGWDCEWVYTVDLDAGTFETYKAGQETESAPTRFSEIIREMYEGDEDGPSFVNLVGTYTLDALPTRLDYMMSVDPEGLERETAWLAKIAAADEEAAEPTEEIDTDNDNDKPSPSM